MPKNFRNGPTIKVLSLGAIPLIINFGWIANTSRQNEIKS